VALAKLCQTAEHTYAGVRCGIMDQAISALGAADRALFLDCRSLAYEHVPLAADRVRVVICDTKVSRGLSSSEYNKRRSECEEAVAALGEAGVPAASLRDAQPADVEKIAGRVPEVVYRRARYVTGEIRRTTEAAEALKAGDLERFGRLANASHDGLRDDYEVSCRELDCMVEIARRCPGVYGARMTGAGFGGCTVNFVEPSRVQGFVATVGERYAEETGLTPEIYVSAAAEGAGRVA
jgi:galactokinase